MPVSQATREPELRKASERDAPALADMLGRAFVDDPFTNFVVRQDAKKSVAMRRFFDVMLHKLSLPHGEVYMAGDGAGAALWAPPGAWELGLWDQIKLAPSLTSTIGLRRVLTVLRGTDAVARKHPHEPHWYLFILGVDPSAQGRGLGSALLKPILERCDRDGVPAYLETATERAMMLYRRHGFAIREEITIPAGPRLWLMWREPRPVPPAR